jgi:hypothetical protein
MSTSVVEAFDQLYALSKRVTPLNRMMLRATAEPLLQALRAAIGADPNHVAQALDQIVAAHPELREIKVAGGQLVDVRTIATREIERMRQRQAVPRRTGPRLPRTPIPSPITRLVENPLPPALTPIPFGGPQTWTAWDQESHSCAGILTPTNLTNLIDGIRQVESAGLRARALGSGWSFSDVAVTSDGVQIDTSQLVSPLDDVIPAALTPLEGDPGSLYHVQAGITIHQLNQNLDKKGLAILTLGGSGGQSLAGAISTGTHGGDFNLPSIGDAVVAIHLVGPGGVQYWIERDVPITDPAKLTALIPGLELRNIHYDHDWFNSVLVSMGCMGVIYSVVLRVRPQFYLQEWRSKQKLLRDVFPALKAGTIFEGTRYLEITINPWDDEAGDWDCWVTKRLEQPAPATPIPARTLDKFAIGSDIINDVFSIVEQLFWWNPILLVAFDAVLGTATGVGLLVDPQCVIAACVNIAQTFHYDNFVRLVTAQILEQARPIETINSPDSPAPIDKGMNIMDTYGYDGPQTLVWAMEICCDATKQSYLDFIQALLNEVGNQASNNHYYTAGLFSARFTGQSSAYMAMQQATLNCTIEIDLLQGVDNAKPTLLQSFEALAYDPKHPGVPHWGMLSRLNPPNTLNIPAMYPKFSSWQEIHFEIARNGDGSLHTFDNDFMAACSLDLTDPPRPIR